MLMPRAHPWTPLQRWIIASAVLFAATGFGAVVYVYERDYRGPPKVPDRQKQEEEIAEAVFRYQFLHNASSRQQHAAVYFLSLRHKNPSKEFILRFAGN